MFNLLVVAAIAVALLYVFSGQLDFFTPKIDPFPKVFSAVSAAKSSAGSTIELGELAFSKKSGLSAEAFSDSGTDAAFECNSPTDCCELGSGCSAAIQWNSKTVVFQGENKVPVFARCNEKYDFFACKIFFGIKPAQLEIAGMEYPSEVNLESNRPLMVALEIKNSGELASSPGTVILSVAKRQANGMVLELPLKKQEKTVGPLNPGAFERFQFGPVALDSAGTYDLVFRAESDNAGFDEKKPAITVTGSAANACRQKTETEPLKIWDAQTGECTTKFFCVGCDLAIDCKDAWEPSVVETLELGDYSFAQTTEFSTQADCR